MSKESGGNTRPVGAAMTNDEPSSAIDEDESAMMPGVQRRLARAIGRSVAGALDDAVLVGGGLAGMRGTWCAVRGRHRAVIDGDGVMTRLGRALFGVAVRGATEAGHECRQRHDLAQQPEGREARKVSADRAHASVCEKAHGRGVAPSVNPALTVPNRLATSISVG